MQKAIYLGTVPISWLKIPEDKSDWEVYPTTDIFETAFINRPHNYLFTLGSGIVNSSYSNIYTSLATAPNYQLPTESAKYIAGRDVLRWGGPKDPLEIDMDRYIFSPLHDKSTAAIFKAPKSEIHHLSKLPDFTITIPGEWRELVDGIQKGLFK